jgi:PPOX class probable F420-dependent enzyme
MTDALERLFGDHGRGVLATLKADGRPQLSTIDFCYDAGTRIARASTIAGLAKVANLRRDPRGSLYVGTGDLGSYAVAEGTVELSPVSAATDDATVEELIDVYRRIQGEHPDWDDYRDAMVQDRRLVLRLHVERFYGLVR